MRIKDRSVSIKGIKTELMMALVIVDQIMKENGQQAVITSGGEETTRHSPKSLHYTGCAVDIRSRNFEHPDRVLAFCIEAFGHNPDIDMILESDHFHLEWQPKRRNKQIS